MGWNLEWLTGSLEQASLIIKGAMCIHNYLVDYMDAYSNDVEEETCIVTLIFEKDCTDRGIQTIIVVNYGGTSSGRPFCNQAIL